jgi:dihydroorotase
LDIFFKNIHIISPQDNLNTKTNLLIRNGKIESIGNIEIDLNSIKVIDSENITCVPGFFDMHVHFRDPGMTEKEDLSSGILSAANGGFTGVLVMPNTEPPVDSPDVMNYIKNKTNNSISDVYISACITKKRQGKNISNFAELIESGAIVFTDDGSSVQDPNIMELAFKYSEEFGVILAQHCEDIYLASGGCINQGNISKNLKLRGIPCISESAIIGRDLMLIQSYRKSKYHIQHISCSESLILFKSAKMHLNNITAEVCPHHFILRDEDCLKFGTNAKMNPPLRSQKDIDSLIDSIKDDTIDIICSDHAPHTKKQKSLSFEQAPFGIVGLETSIGLAYTYLIKNKVISFEKMIEKMSINPRNLLNLPQIKLKKGENANLTLLKLNETWKINPDKFKSKGRNTPFEGFDVSCKPYAVINNNQIFFSEL